MLPFYESLEKALKTARDNGGLRLASWPLFILGIVLLCIAYIFFPYGVAGAINIALFLAPLWLPVLIVSGAWTMWIVLRRSEFIARQTNILLEIKPPRNLVKTPLAMEAVLAGIHHAKGESNWYQRSWLGQVRPYWSIEMVSLEGQVHFYMWTRRDFRKLIENAFYAQYPGVQIVEVPDYTKMISAEPGEWGVWGCDYKQTESDPYPIKTYIEYGLDRTQKEPEQIDPMAHLVEFLGSMGKKEYLWLQFIVRTHGGEKYHKLNAKGKPYTWKDEAARLVSEIRAKTRESYVDMVTGEERPGFPNPTKMQSETMAALERNTSKLAFDVGIRAVYVVDPKRFDGINVTGMIGLFKPFNSEGWNGLKAAHFGIDFSDYPWELGNEPRKDRLMRKPVVEAYRRRQYFHEPFAMPDPMVMSTEELATLFHIPSASVKTPTLPRIESATSEAPSNLPT